MKRSKFTLIINYNIFYKIKGILLIIVMKYFSFDQSKTFFFLLNNFLKSAHQKYELKFFHYFHCKALIILNNICKIYLFQIHLIIDFHSQTHQQFI